MEPTHLKGDTTGFSTVDNLSTESVEWYVNLKDYNLVQTAASLGFDLTGPRLSSTELRQFNFGLTAALLRHGYIAPIAPGKH